MSTKEFFHELLVYNHKYNQQTLQVIGNHSGDVTDKINRIQSHIVNVHSIWNAKVLGEGAVAGAWEVYPIERMIGQDTTNLSRSVLILETFDLDHDVTFTTASGRTLRNAIRDILFQIVNHSTYHRGQLALEFRSCGIDPIVSDWIAHKMWV